MHYRTVNKYFIKPQCFFLFERTFFPKNIFCLCEYNSVLSMHNAVYNEKYIFCWDILEAVNW